MANQLLNLARTKLEKAGVEAHNTVMIISKEMIAFCILAVIVSWVVVSILSKQIVRPVAALSNASRSIANGRNVEKVEYSSSDEIGQLCKCFNNMNRELNRQVEEREKAESHNRRLLEILEEKNKELQNVVYVASHDLKSPLVTINGFSEEVRGLCNDIRKVIEAEPFNGEVKDKVMTLLREDIPQDLKFISAGANKMQMLIGGLLQVSRIGTAVVNMEALHMNDLLKKVEESIQYSIIEKKVELNIDNLPMCYGDETMINQVFSNLLDNAIKYLDDNRDPVINVVGWREGDKCIYCVSDNGVGISEKNQSKIFEIFHRLDPHGQVQGDGLGLTIVGRILERHGGSIWVESETGVGSSFFVSLPSVSQKDWKQ